jgi:predicted Zn finger-like uncharacterized protein
MVAENPSARDRARRVPTAAIHGKKPALSGHLDRKVIRDVSLDNIWENRVASPAPARGGVRCNVKISCPACAAKYSIADEKVQDKLAKIRCRKCGTTIVIDGKVSPPNVYAGEAGASHTDSTAVSDPGAAATSAPAGAGEYSVDFGDNDQRTMSVADLVAAYNAGHVTAETFVWADGMADWQPLGQVSAIVDALHAASAPQAAAAPAAAPVAAAAASAPMLQSSDFAAPAPTPWEASAAQPAAEVPSASRAAARPGGGRGSTADLFGAYETAGGEADVTTSARDSATSAPAAGATTGARNESSVLFSLSALTSTAKTSTPAVASSLSGGSTTTKEDSGLIDLKALTAAAEPSAAPMQMAPLAPSPLGMAPPLGLAPLGGGVEAQIAMPPQTKSRTGIYIGAGIAIAAVAIAAAIIVTNKQPPAPAVAATQAAPAPTPTPTPTPTEESTAKAPATGTAEDEKAPKDGKVAATTRRNTGGVKSGGAKPSSGAKPTSGGTEAKKPPAKPKSGGCGCAPGDLQCAMKCAAGGG